MKSLMKWLLPTLMIGLVACEKSSTDDDNNSGADAGMNIIASVVAMTYEGVVTPVVSAFLSDDADEPITDATVSVNNHELTYEPYSMSYLLMDQIPVTGGSSYDLSVTSDVANWQASATMPGDFEVTAPEDGGTFTGTSLNVTWTAAENAQYYLLMAWDQEDNDLSFEVLEAGTLNTSIVVPESSTEVHLALEALNGVGSPDNDQSIAAWHDHFHNVKRGVMVDSFINYFMATRYLELMVMR